MTGGTGYLGRSIVDALARAGHEPIVFARRAAAARLPGVAVDGDIRDRDAVSRAVSAADAVCHTAALVSLWRPRAQDFDDVNVHGLEYVLEACARRGVSRILYTSSFLALPPAGSDVAVAHNDYQRTKVAALDVARRAARGGAPLVILAPGVIYGPGVETEGNLLGRLVRDHLARRLPGLVGASRIWPYAYVDDVAQAHVRALEAPDLEDGIEMPLGGEDAPQMRAFEIVRELTGRPLPRRIPYPAALAAACYEEARAAVTGRPPRVTRGAVAIFRHDWPLESAAARARLGYTPRPLREGIASMLADAGRGTLEPFLH